MKTGNHQALIQEIFGISDAIRYVAVYQNGELAMRQRENISQPSAGESDKYEELIVNPAVLKILTQRGNIDCGGLEYVIIRYGNFLQSVVPFGDGHISTCIDKNKEAAEIEEIVRQVISKL
jgi:hypothetical protein